MEDYTLQIGTIRYSKTISGLTSKFKYAKLKSVAIDTTKSTIRLSLSHSEPKELFNCPSKSYTCTLKTENN